MPIVSPRPSINDVQDVQGDAARANQAAQLSAILSEPIVVPVGNPRRAYNQGYQDAKNEAKNEADRAEVKKIRASITDTNLLYADVLRDLGIKTGDNIVTRDLLGYLRQWVRIHHESTTNSVALGPQKK
jgi:hypothetical protein